jgi:hypothetical protein
MMLLVGLCDVLYDGSQFVNRLMSGNSMLLVRSFAWILTLLLGDMVAYISILDSILMPLSNIWPRSYIACSFASAMYTFYNASASAMASSTFLQTLHCSSPSSH